MNHFDFGKELFDRIQELAPQSLKLRTYQKDDIIYHVGSEPEALYFIKSGLVGLIDIAKNGDESLLRVFGHEHFFGHRSLVSEEPYHATSIALKKTNILFINKEDLKNLCQDHSELLLYIAKVLAKELRRSEIRLKDMSSKKVADRIIESLIFLKTRYPHHKWTRREIGEFCGAKTETVSRTLSSLEQQGLIKREGRSIMIPEPQLLLDFIHNGEERH